MTPQKPNFLICGAAASGTSFLASGLKQHPAIYLPQKMRPEPHYFYYSANYQNPARWYEEKWFSAVQSETAIGEKSTSYIYGKHVAERIATYNAGMKLIFILRNPIDRAYASYRNTALQGLESQSFDEALVQEPARMASAVGRWAETQPHAYMDRGFYFKQLTRFLAVFPRQQLLILKFDDMARNEADLFRSVFRFLGVDENFTPKPPARFENLSVIDPMVQMRAREHFRDRFDLVIDGIRRKGSLANILEGDGDHAMAEAILANLHAEPAKMSPWARDHLTGVFAKDLDKLKDIVEFSLDDWM